MKNPEFALFTGLPRTGSTIVKAILNQNPQIYASKNSPLCNTMWNFPDLLGNNMSFSASPNMPGLHRIMQNMMPLYYQEKLNNRKIIFDKGFSWGVPANYNMIKRVLGYDPRFLVTTRNFDDVLDSLVRLIKQNPNTNVFCKNMLIDPNLSFKKNVLKHLNQEGHILHLALVGLENLQKNHSKDCFFIDYDEFCITPEKILKDFYKFFKLTYFKHNLNNIVDPEREDDSVYGIPNLHEIRPTITKIIYEKNTDNGTSRSGKNNSSKRTS